jgi:hypothetical protein
MRQRKEKCAEQVRVLWSCVMLSLFRHLPVRDIGHSCLAWK